MTERQQHPGRIGGNQVVAQSPFLARIGALARVIGRNMLIVAFILLLAFMAVWYATPYFLRDFLNKKGAGLPDYHLHIGWVQINPWNCSIDVEDVTLAKRSDEVPVPFFTCPRVHVAMQWREILHFSLRSSISLTRPVVNFVEGPTAATSQIVLEPAWVSEVKQLVPLRINQFTITQGDVHFYDFHADPEINMEMDRIELSLNNLTNSNGSKSLMPSTAVLSGRPFEVGEFDANLALNVDLKQPTFAEKVKLENIPAPDLNAFLAKYANVYAKSGELNFYTEMVSDKGDFKGYAKPFFQNLEFEPVPKDRKGLAALWASIVNGLKDVLQNDKNAVATTVPISGHFQDPNIDFWSAAFGLVKNAYLQALAQGFEHPEIAPAPARHDISATAMKQAQENGH
jgi:hypothetical protein